MEAFDAAASNFQEALNHDGKIPQRIEVTPAQCSG